MIVKKRQYLETDYDAVLVGTGIMSATLGILLTEIFPDIRILFVEKLISSALESSAALNNAGTGHAANCELNYTPFGNDNQINIEKALEINTSFERSLEFWSFLVEQGKLNPEKFLKFVPHISLVIGEENFFYLTERYKYLSTFIGFKNMEISSSFQEIKAWIPLICRGRDKEEKICATRVNRGTDINFGALTNEYIKILAKQNNIHFKFLTEVISLDKRKDGWDITLRNKEGEMAVRTGFVFLGAGGSALSLLQKSNIRESKGYAGFPISGKWLICEKDDLTSLHNAKVYGKVDIGSPPMSVPHLDTRWIEGKKYLLFGPFAGLTTKFLNTGSNLDFFRSLRKENILSITQVGLQNYDLVRYLISQVLSHQKDKINSLKNFMPSVNPDDWQIMNAGKRVQIIKSYKNSSQLKFGTEVVSSRDGTLSALLGASPGASTAITIMLEVISNSAIKNLFDIDWSKKIKLILPSYGDNLVKNSILLDKTRQRNNSILGF